MSSIAARIPKALWQNYRQRHPTRFEVVHLRLQDGKIHRNYVVSENGIILGRIVGGHDGVDSTAIDFSSGDDIVAVRRGAGLIATLGLTRWVTGGV